MRGPRLVLASSTEYRRRAILRCAAGLMIDHGVVGKRGNPRSAASRRSARNECELDLACCGAGSAGLTDARIMRTGRFASTASSGTTVPAQNRANAVSLQKSPSSMMGAPDSAAIWVT